MPSMTVRRLGSRIAGGRLLLALVLGLLVPLPPGAHAGVLCVGKHKAVFLREACRRKEKPLVVDPAPQGRPGDSGPTGSAGPTGPTGSAGPSGADGGSPGGGPPLRVVDAHGADVGWVTSLEKDGCDPGTLVMREIVGAWFRFTVSAGGFAGSPRPFHYDDATCAGARYFRLDDVAAPLGGFAPTLSIDRTLVGHYVADAEGADRPLWRRETFLASCGDPAPDFPDEPELLLARCVGVTNPPAGLCRVAECTAVGIHPAAPVRTIDLKTLQLLSPFRLTR